MEAAVGGCGMTQIQHFHVYEQSCKMLCLLWEQPSTITTDNESLASLNSLICSNNPAVNVSISALLPCQTR